MKNFRGEELTSPEQIATAERASIYWARRSRDLCSECGAPIQAAYDNPFPNVAAGTCGEPDACRLRKAAYEAALLFEQRTVAVVTARPSIMTASPAGRVSWTEIRERFGLKGAEDRVAFQPLFEAALKRRKLLGVLRRRQTSAEWVAKHYPRNPRHRQIV